uniref:PARP16 N-terminal domain-containing protein n=1 Tax=Stomoxys calcitrans TaxID=35570 RepID=A0A1I8Q1T8_STOCA
MANASIEHPASSGNFQTKQSSEIDILRSQLINEDDQPLMSSEFFNKTQELLQVLVNDLMACDAKWTLFVATAFSYQYEHKLIPFPPKFAHEETGHDIDALVMVINDTPKLTVILDHIVEENFQELNKEVIELLYWVLITQNNPSLRLLDGQEVEAMLQSMGMKDLPLKPTFIFEIMAAQEFHSQQAFGKVNSVLPLRKGFYGHKLDTFYSIIHNGFTIAHCKGQETLMLSTDFLTTLHKSPCGTAWGYSLCGSLISCTALCEFAYDSAEDNTTPNSRDKAFDDFEIKDPKRVRMRYLLIYGSRLLQEKNHSKDAGKTEWYVRHKYTLAMTTYLLVLASIAVVNSGVSPPITSFIVQKLHGAYECLRKFLAT